MRFQRGRRRATTTPVFDTSFGNVFRNHMIGMALMIAVPLLALKIFGQPAIRFQYWYHGSADYPVYERCLYLALDGLHDVPPRYGAGTEACPLVISVPADLSALLF